MQEPQTIQVEHIKVLTHFKNRSVLNARKTFLFSMHFSPGQKPSVEIFRMRLWYMVSHKHSLCDKALHHAASAAFLNLVH